MKGRVVIVTGGAKGIGRHAAHTLAKAGAKVVLADADAERLYKTSRELKEIGGEVLALATDVRDEKDVRRMAHETIERFGQIDALINDAGIVPHFNWGIPRWPRVRNLSYDFWNSVIQTNLGGTFLCSKYVVPFMEERRSGNIVNLWGGGRRKITARRPTSLAKMRFARLPGTWPRKNVSGIFASLPSALDKRLPPKTHPKKPANVCPARNH